MADRQTEDTIGRRYFVGMHRSMDDQQNIFEGALVGGTT